MSPQHQKKSGGERKYGRNKIKCGIYRMLHKKERSHVRRIEKHMKRYKDNSPMVVEALDRYRRAIVTK
jgi:hypothetical protein